MQSVLHHVTNVWMTRLPVLLVLLVTLLMVPTLVMVSSTVSLEVIDPHDSDSAKMYSE